MMNPTLVIEFTPFNHGDEVRCDWCEDENAAWYNDLLNLAYCKDCMADIQAEHDTHNALVIVGKEALR